MATRLCVQHRPTLFETYQILGGEEQRSDENDTFKQLLKKSC